MFVSTSISTVAQLAIVLLTALLLYWPLRGRERPPFVTFLGLGSPRLIGLIVGCFLGFVAAAGVLAIPGMAAIAGGQGSVVHGIIASGLDLEAVTTLIVLATVKTALSEEIFFRGLIAKRSVAWFGPVAGNAAQALVFGAVHFGLMLALRAGLLVAAAFGVFTTAMALTASLLNERLGNSTIWPGWAMHATSNLVSYLWIAYKLHA